MSTFRELFSDYQAKVNEYKEKAQITEPSFMRKFTQGMSIFQENTEYLERTTLIPKTDGKHYVPYDLYKVVELGNCRTTFIKQDYQQLIRQVQTRRISTTPEFFDERKYLDDDDFYNPVRREHHKGTPLYSIWDREIVLSHPEGDLTMKYIPRLDVFSERSPLWYRTIGEVYDIETVSCTLTSNSVEVPDHDLNIGDAIQFSTLVTTTGISTGVSYYVMSVQRDSFTISDTLGGTALTFTDGTGTYVRQVLTTGGVYYKVLRDSLTLSTVVYTEGQYFIGDGTAPTGTGYFQQIDSGNTWYPFDVFFYQRFETRGIHPSLVQFENLFVLYAAAMYLQELVSGNFKEYLQEFWDGVNLAKQNKPNMFTEARSDYFMPTGSNRSMFEEDRWF